MRAGHTHVPSPKKGEPSGWRSLGFQAPCMPQRYPSPVDWDGASGLGRGQASHTHGARVVEKLCMETFGGRSLQSLQGMQCTCAR